MDCLPQEALRRLSKNKKKRMKKRERKQRKREEGTSKKRKGFRLSCRGRRFAVRKKKSGSSKASVKNGSVDDSMEKEQVLPFEFAFGVEKPVPVEKSEFDLEIDKLWAEQKVALTYLYADKGKEEYPPKRECRGPTAKHDTRLDEEIGEICSLCGKLLVEIKYISPQFLGGQARYCEVFLPQNQV